MNKIGRLRKEDGGWVEEEVEKKDFISNHFAQLFRARAIEDTQLLQAMSPKVTTEMNSDLVREFTPEEVKSALEAIGDASRFLQTVLGYSGAASDAGGVGSAERWRYARPVE